MSDNVLVMMFVAFIAHCVLLGYIVKLWSSGEGWLQKREQELEDEADSEESATVTPIRKERKS